MYENPICTGIAMMEQEKGLEMAFGTRGKVMDLRPSDHEWRILEDDDTHLAHLILSPDLF